MEADSIKDSTRYIVNQVHYGNICPSNRTEMWRNVFLEEGASIKGGIFGNSLNILQSNVTVENSVYVRGEIKIKNINPTSKGEINFESTVVSPDSLLIEEGGFIVRFNSDIYVDKINIVNSIVYGNVYCSSAIVENCIILGGIYCKKNLSLKNSIVYTFDTNELEIKNNVSLLSPFGISTSPFSLEFPVKALTFYNIEKDTNEDSYLLSLEKDDIFELKLFDKNNNSKSRYLLSIVERVLNSTEIIKSFKSNKKMIEFLSLGAHIDKNYSEHYKDFTKQYIENKLWQIINKKIDQPKPEKRKNVKQIFEEFLS